ncbi:SOS response-associated peptidase [bacterium SCSIO 12741]|nr:SOS response-associated peptidase [bacterium SCSIO 12741]
MCFHYALSKKVKEVAERYKVILEQDLPAGDDPVFHVAGFDFPVMPVVTNEQPDRLQFFQWGLIPSWTKSVDDAKLIRTRTLNARSETAWEKPSFRSAIKSKRCLVPATGFYEWMEFQKKKYPHYIHLKDQSIFSFAGIWEEWADQESGEIHSTYSILTTEANPFMARIHNTKKRMPVMLSPDQERQWIGDSPPSLLKELTIGLPEDTLDAHTISKRITSRTENSNVSEVQQPFSYPELQLLF